MASQSDVHRLVDLRSDALCAPTEAMWEAMRRAEVGWALKGEDQAVNKLEAIGAELLGKEAALFVPTCSMANVLALMTIGEPGTRLIAGRTMHVATTEALSLAHPIGLIPHLVDDGPGVPDWDEIVEAFACCDKGPGARVSLLCLENSHNNAGGVAITAERTVAVADIARRFGAAVHLDGARLFNSAVALGVPASSLAEPADTVSISLSKGLGAPLGALLCGSQAVIEGARLSAKRIGAASMHKAGIFAAAGLVALTTMIDQLAEDNDRAAMLARSIAELPGLYVRPQDAQTNLVLVELAPSSPPAHEIVAELARRGVLALARAQHSIRFVTYRQISDRDISLAAQALGRVVGETS